MNAIAQYKLDAIASLLTPDFGFQVSPEAVRIALESIRGEKPITIRDASKIYGVPMGTLKMRIQRHGVIPAKIGKGGSNSAANLYYAADIIALCAK